MKFLKILAWIIGALILLLLVLLFVLPTNIKVEKTVSMDASKQMVFNAVNNLKSWETWNPWQKMDESMEMSYGEKFVGEGGSYSWKSENMGNGSYTITESKKDESIKSKMSFEGQGDGYGYWNFVDNDGKTDVTWGFETTMKRPMNLMAPLMKGSMKKTMKNGLKGIEKMIKDRMENKTYNGFKMQEVDLGEKHFVMKRAEVPMSGIQQFYAQNLGDLFGKVQQAGAEMSGMPCGLYFKWDEASGIADMAAAIPVGEALNIKDAMSHTIAAGKAIQVDHFGPYHNIGDAHYAIDDFFNDNGLLSNMPCVEEYVTDPETEKDESKWLTKITYYIAE